MSTVPSFLLWGTRKITGAQASLSTQGAPRRLLMGASGGPLVLRRRGEGLLGFFAEWGLGPTC